MSKDDRDDELERDDEETSDEEEELLEDGGASGGVLFLAGFVLGALLGAGTALLLAPERGQVVRRRIRGRLDDFRDDAVERVGDWRKEARRELRRQRRRLKDRLPGR
jgi:hypothetical protein